jgi:hypothetical protein
VEIIWNVRFEVSTVLTLKDKVFCIATWGSRVTDSQCSKHRYWLRLWRLRSPRRSARTHEPLKMNDVPAKCQKSMTLLLCILIPKT